MKPIEKISTDSAWARKINELIEVVNKQADEISFLAQICKRYEDEKDAEFDANQTQIKLYVRKKGKPRGKYNRPSKKNCTGE